jgi:hypothetical protein
MTASVASNVERVELAGGVSIAAKSGFAVGEVMPNGRIAGMGPGAAYTGEFGQSIEVTIDTAQLRSKFKHAADFGVTGNPNKANLAAFQDAIDAHIADPANRVIQGTYRGNPVTHIVNPSSGINVLVAPDSSFISGWKLNPAQLKNVLTRGSL